MTDTATEWERLRYRAALESAEEFIERVERWKGQDPDELHEMLDVIRSALSEDEAA